MKVAGLILGIIGGVSGLGSTLWKLFWGGVAGAAGDEAAGGLIILMGLLMGLASIVAIVAAAMSMSRPLFSGITQLVATVISLITFSWVTFVFFLLGGIFAMVGWRQDQTAAAAAGSSQESA